MSASAPLSEPLSVTPLVEELVPCPDPWDVARKLAHLPHLLFLDSAERNPERGRYSYVMADPDALIVRSVGDLATCDPFDDGWFDYPRIERPSGTELPPFLGGWAGLFGYNLGRAFDRQPLPRTDEYEVPVLALGVYDWVIAFDHQAGRAWLVSTGQEHVQTFTTRREAAVFRADVVKDCLAGRDISWYLGEGERRWPGQPSDQPGPAHPIVRHSLSGFPGVTSNFSRAGYLAAVRRAIEYTHAGDCFQVNLSQRLLTPLTEHPLELYGRLRQTNPAPFACYFDAGEFQIVSASPERFLKVSPNGEVVTKPIKGTRPRGKTPQADAANVRDLVTSPKDRAENIMIVDLLRNDLGRVCEYGSVTVPKVCEVESYRDVHHLVSEVRGKLRPGMTPFDLLRAAFPGGSVTGAPKVRAMEIIAELEPTARGPYCGSVGFIGFDGSMDTNILIRTFTAGRGWLQFPVGGGIVADSDPEREYEETLHKAAGLLRALANPDGTPHLAPMGPHVEPDMRWFLLRPFPTSNTYQNLSTHGEGVLHVTDDVLLLAKAAVGLAKTPELRPATAVRGWVIADACQAHEFRVRSIDASEQRVRIECEVVRSESLRDFFGFNRGKHAVLEAAILATRLHLLPREDVQAEYRKLRVIVDKTGGPAEREAMAFLEDHLARHPVGGPSA